MPSGAVSEQLAAASAFVDGAFDANLNGSHPVTLHGKMLPLELLNVKAELERELGQLVLDCSSCGRTVHWVSGLGMTPSHRRIAGRRRCCSVTPALTDAEAPPQVLPRAAGRGRLARTW